MRAGASPNVSFHLDNRKTRTSYLGAATKSALFLAFCGF